MCVVCETEGGGGGREQLQTGALARSCARRHGQPRPLAQAFPQPNPLTHGVHQHSGAHGVRVRARGDCSQTAAHRVPNLSHKTGEAGVGGKRQRGRDAAAARRRGRGSSAQGASPPRRGPRRRGPRSGRRGAWCWPRCASPSLRARVRVGGVAVRRCGQRRRRRCGANAAAAQGQRRATHPPTHLPTQLFHPPHPTPPHRHRNSSAPPPPPAATAPPAGARTGRGGGVGGPGWVVVHGAQEASGQRRQGEQWSATARWPASPPRSARL